MSATIRTPRWSEEDRIAAGRLRWGAWVGLVAAALALLLPSFALFLTGPEGPRTLGFGTELVRATGLLVLLGATFFVVSLFLYRRAFAHLRKSAPEFALASALCLVGSVGFLLILVAAAYLTGSATSLESCFQGHPSNALSCMETNQPLGAYTAIVGFVLGWLGGGGFVLGLWLACDHFVERTIARGSVLYLLLLLLALGPFLELLFTVPGGGYLLLLLPLVGVAAPTLVLFGILPRTRPSRPVASA